MYAVIKTGGKQYKVSEGDIIKVEKLPAEEGQEIVFEEVLLINDENGNVKVGKPLVEGAKVTAQVLEQGKGKKIYVMKYKRRKNYRRKKGHRQPFTKVKIQKIEG
ncbi:large subunit ribosomal protein L21 [Thermosyntropha lipolytica DSM 11003]|uniref:Large ribosomal subunit protein bL21 n=1 Tax=Thermosyntropha lipolytica DSM 11003 TaxID=1123382 RepID=A0A1M5R2P9_9FIRM|nr:50S ribosomal protein L21 [Thermosyntropha lipolytica]SHH20386.1 large subunit ribosomal protein L21 [Thermosyntropha lipolytica DSM 11003]